MDGALPQPVDAIGRTPPPPQRAGGLAPLHVVSQVAKQIAGEFTSGETQT